MHHSEPQSRVGLPDPNPMEYDPRQPQIARAHVLGSSTSAIIVWRQFGNEERKLLSHIDAREELFRHGTVLVRRAGIVRNLHNPVKKLLRLSKMRD